MEEISNSCPTNMPRVSPLTLQRVSSEEETLTPVGSQGRLLGGGDVYMHNQHEAYINLVRWESKKHLRLPGSIWDAERETAALPAFLLK